MEGYYEGLNELREASSVDDVNKLLKEGFQVLRIADRTTTDLLTKSVITAPLYIMGKKANAEQAVITQKVITESVKVPALEWREKDDSFSWAFVGDREGHVSEESKAFRDLLKAKGEVRVGEFTYKLSKDERLFNRVKHKESS
ncbi:MAG: hypothetical protein JRN52_10865 [Nitrososphaerota archaeon]|nr:hypothetical protein [Nitrososphaerota archaeon]